MLFESGIRVGRYLKFLRLFRGAAFLCLPMGLTSAGLAADALAGADPSNKLAHEKHLGTPELMQDIHKSIVKILPHSVGVSGFSSKVHSKMIGKELATLESLGSELVKNAAVNNKGDDAFTVIAESFAADTSAMNSAFKKHEYRNARFVFQNITSNCISCHTRQTALLDQKVIPLYTSLSNEHLSLVEKAELNTAVRNFEVALEQYEKAFSKNYLGQIPGILLEGYLIDYMIVGLKVKDEKPRVMKQIESLAFNASVPLSTQRVLSKWLGFIKTYDPKADYSNVENIMKLYEKGQALNSHPFDSSGALAAILVGKHLQKLLVEDSKLSDTTKSKAYYIYGLCEMTLRRPQQLSKVDYYLERAILTSPKSENARRAYTVLEDYIYFENTGSSGANVPKSELDKLKKLQKML